MLGFSFSFSGYLEAAFILSQIYFLQTLQLSKEIRFAGLNIKTFELSWFFTYNMK